MWSSWLLCPWPFSLCKVLNLGLSIIFQVIPLLHLVVTSMDAQFLLLLLLILGFPMLHHGDLVPAIIHSIAHCSLSQFNQGVKVLLANIQVRELVCIAMDNHLSSSEGGIGDAIHEFSDLLGLGNRLLQISEIILYFLAVDIGLESVAAIPIVTELSP